MCIVPQTNPLKTVRFHVIKENCKGRGTSRNARVKESAIYQEGQLTILPKILDTLLYVGPRKETPKITNS
jgi:hypothetical protein